MKIEVGMYCYDKINRKLGIGKIFAIDQNNNFGVCFSNEYKIISAGNLIASFDIIDLIEVGDYVNGLLVTRICEDIETNKKYINLYGSISEWEEEDIKSIVTKEQFENVSYKIEKKKSGCIE